MAKFGRYDSGNKKRNRHKNESRNGFFKKIKLSDKGSSKKKIDVKTAMDMKAFDV